MLLQNGRKSWCGFTGQFLFRMMRGIMLMLAVILVFGCISVAITDFDVNGQSRVYAVDSQIREDGKGQQVQAGLMGVVNGVANMERYSDTVRIVSVANDNETILAGVSGVDRRALRRYTMGQGTNKIASQLSYYAQQAVYENQMPSDEYYTLLHIVEAEATGGDVMSKMMVAGVVLNRVKDSHFPDTIYEVVWQRAQFQPTSDGRIYSCSITDSTVEAVERVLQGENYSQDALFFVARDTAESKNLSWFDSSLVKLYEYGGHEYFTFKDYVDNV